MSTKHSEFFFHFQLIGYVLYDDVGLRWLMVHCHFEKQKKAGFHVGMWHEHDTRKSIFASTKMELFILGLQHVVNKRGNIWY